MASTGGSAYMKFLGQGGELIPGESFNANFPADKGWFELSDWGWDVESEHKHTGTGLAVGKAKCGILNFSHAFDQSSPVLLSYMIQGMHFKSVQIDMLKITGADTPETYFRLTAGSVFVHKLSNKADEEGKIVQEVECTFKEINLQYKKQLIEGPKMGSLTNAGCMVFMWNVAEQTFTNSPLITVESL